MACLDDEARDSLEALIGAFFPDDGTSPSARELGILGYFEKTVLDTSLNEEHWYRAAPFRPDSPAELGWQSAQTPAEYFLDTLRALETECERRFGARFGKLDAATQETVLRQLEAGSFLPDIRPPTGTFIRVLANSVQEAILRDPVFGGNRDYRGWQWLQLGLVPSAVKMRVA